MGAAAVPAGERPPLPPEPDELLARAEAARAAAQGDPRLPRRSQPLHNGDRDDGTPGVRRAVLGGSALVLLALLGLGLWAVLVPLEDAVRAPGTVAEAAGRLAVTAPADGRLARVLVHEGASVDAGAPLLELDAGALQRQRLALQQQQDVLEAAQARLETERDNGFEIVFPPVLLEHAHDPKQAVRIYKLLEDQKQLFVARRAAFAGELELLRAQENRLRERSRSLEGALGIIDNRQKWVGTEVAKSRGAVAGHDEQAYRRMLAREGTEAQSDGATLAERKAEAEDALHAVSLRILDLRNQRGERVQRELEGVQRQLAEVERRLGDLDEAGAQLRIAATVAGRVDNLTAGAPGDSIAAGAHLLDLQPGGPPTVLATVAPEDIGALQVGQPVRMRIEAFPGVSLPAVEGHVAGIADRQPQPGPDGRSGFPVRIDFDPASLALFDAALAREQRSSRSNAVALGLRAGMPVEVTVRVPARSLLGGLL